MCENKPKKNNETLKPKESVEKPVKTHEQCSTDPNDRSPAQGPHPSD